ncbi:MAG TPA: penicillin acylase family protein, partial [Tahibacter sp.]|nr:penicillin acylase family protein [Tahibacter sp.]
VDPANARLWSANARLVDGDWLALVGDGGYDLGARQRQIRDDLLARERFTVDDLLAVQLDDRAVFLAPWRELMRATVAGLDDPAFAALRGDGANARASVDAHDYALVREFRLRTIAAALAPFEALVKKHDKTFELPSAQTYEAPVWALVTGRPPHLLDPRYEDWNELLVDAAREAAKDVDGKTWGARNTASIRHPLSRALPGFVGRYLDMPAEPLPGDKNMPRVQGPATGASERFTIAPGRENESYLMMPGGQSGHPLSPFHGAGHDDWARGKPTPLLPGATQHRLELVPAGA